MNKQNLTTLVGAAAALAIITLAGLFAVTHGVAADKPTWQAVSAQAGVGKNIRIEVKLVGIDPPPPAADITVTRTRIDMGPDGMETMAAPLKPLPTTTPGVLAFETELVMAGRWAFAITATVKGRTEPVSGTVVFTATEKKSEAMPPEKREILYYRNPMGLADISKTPKKDSMGMDYIPVYRDEVQGPQGVLRLGPEKIQRSGVRTAPAQRQVLSRTVRGTGTVVPDETRLSVVTAKFSGFVEELYVPATGERVKQGQPLMRVWIESPEILQKQADLTAALAPGAARNGIDIDSVERNLRFFGFDAEAIDTVRKARRPLRDVTFKVQRSGTVLDKPAMVGMRFGSGDVLFRMADLSQVWVNAQIAERDLAAVKVGQKASVTLQAYPDQSFAGRVGLIYPELNVATRTIPVRIVLPNPDGRLLSGLYADVAIDAHAADGAVVVIPESAIIDSGTRKVAFVAKNEGRFEPRDLVLGARGNGVVEIRSGIAENESVVTSGNFLIDAESNLKAALTAFTSGQAGQ
ncbi:efflux RND transporter periplasmic adaptor subunit [Bradyrhizobium sp. LHD-71]|uniref:efflux RND transporter periplasmic adaptor subunit n=1 Tax=Bradyrhizobium sp. LHD-71 TaxID=3072141 RepID=UPI00280ED022|nr:efflux RND transporter periplasmic adaptor subunit [Bradyrhizobium sp. LHD-71]MDQ8732611.1 efflux RND transporter periplasmic adaptor subunit [Bradyrhizobium sp. LHD-71]